MNSSIQTTTGFARILKSKRWSPLSLNPIAWYKAELNANDSIGNFNGIQTTTGGKYPTGIIGSAFNRNISIPDKEGNMFTTQTLTVSAWVKNINLDPNKRFLNIPFGDRINSTKPGSWCLEVG